MLPAHRLVLLGFLVASLLAMPAATGQPAEDASFLVPPEVVHVPLAGSAPFSVAVHNPGERSAVVTVQVAPESDARDAGVRIRPLEVRLQLAPDASTVARFQATLAPGAATAGFPADLGVEVDGTLRPLDAQPTEERARFRVAAVLTDAVLAPAWADGVSGALVGGAAVLALGAAAHATWARFRPKRLRPLPLLPGYTRIRRDAALEDATRRAVYEAIHTQPGITLSELRDATGLSLGGLSHHLRILEGHRLVSSRRDGRVRRYATSGQPFPAAPLPPAQVRVLAELEANGPRTQRDLAAALGVSRQAVGPPLDALRKRGRVARTMGPSGWVYAATASLPG